ncbi:MULTISPECIES: apolipoprotein N-acyltransferase [Sphingobacterium]|uniref:apolipoprotein N-acyltransferase n=1 Tax=Sphingobacterium TaxID=28453 RepID=UPI00104F0A05|nr:MULTISPECIES: apolipoprotein N-acyltransferase [Sphingobacterium]MCW2261039.1 apolipoprotein N-acyltransferase [Sphingobacterium kitahiroshimense]TCR08326.1 apolipoprotein N-acyltransferase [Sphingobacterium sp. JUb78]
MRNQYLLALLSAFLLWLGWPPVPYSSPILLIAFLPLLIAVENIFRNETYIKKGKKIFLTAGLTAVLWNTASIYWVYNSISAVMPWYIAIFISLIPFLLGALLMALAFRLYYQMRKKVSIIPSLFGLMAFWISYEYLHQSWDLAFPWMTLGNGFSNFHQLIQWYEFTGVYGGTMWIWLSNILIFLLYLNKKEMNIVAKPRRITIVLVLTLLIPSSYSVIRYMTYEEHINPSQIVTVQPNIDPFGKFGHISPEEQLQTLMKLSKSVANPNTEFFIWPETALSQRGDFDEEDFRITSTFDSLINFLNDYKNGNVLSGIESYRLYNDKRTSTAREVGPNLYKDNFNAATLVDVSSKLQFYHKSKLVPGVEQMPFGTAINFLKPLFSAFGGTTGGYGKQDKPSVFYSQSGIGAAPVICYESIWGNYVAQYIQQGAQFIAIITNDGWWGNTSGKDQHLDYAKLRAIENRRWVARSANTGISGFINQRGDIIQKTDWWVPAALTQEINLSEELTIYTKNGDILAYLGLLGALLATLTFFKKSKTSNFIK